MRLNLSSNRLVVRRESAGWPSVPPTPPLLWSSGGGSPVEQDPGSVVNLPHSRPGSSSSADEGMKVCTTCSLKKSTTRLPADGCCVKNSHKKAITHAKCSLSLLVSPLRVPASRAESLLTSAGDGWGRNLCLGLFILQDSCQRTAGGGWKLDKIGHISQLKCLSLLLFLLLHTCCFSLSLPSSPHFSSPPL